MLLKPDATVQEWYDTWRSEMVTGRWSYKGVGHGKTARMLRDRPRPFGPLSRALYAVLDKPGPR